MKIALNEEFGNLNLTSDLITSCVKMNKQFDYQKVPSIKNENNVLDFCGTCGIKMIYLI